ncbi:MAG: hypothetical protein J0I12_01975 [Candidatus Eremiobacteraeota bacterium]|nr:hypothetical protein [Candidatus Eremiobacteraeota bacterium]
MLRNSLLCLGLFALAGPSWADSSEWARWSKFRFGGNVRQIIATGFYVHTPSGADVYVRQDEKVLRNGQMVNPTFLRPNDNVQVLVAPGRGQIRHREDNVAILPTPYGVVQVPENNLQLAMEQAALASARQTPVSSAQYFLSAPAARPNQTYSYGGAPIYAPNLSYGYASNGYDTFGYDPYAYDPGYAQPVSYYQQPYIAPAAYYPGYVQPGNFYPQPVYSNNFSNRDGSFNWGNAAVSLLGTALVATLSNQNNFYPYPNQGWNNYDPGYYQGQAWNNGYTPGYYQGQAWNNGYNPGYYQGQAWNNGYNPGYAPVYNNFVNYAPRRQNVNFNRPWNRAVFPVNGPGPGGNWRGRNNGWTHASYGLNRPAHRGWNRAQYRVNPPRQYHWNRPKYRGGQPRYNNNFRPRNNGWNRAQYRVSQPRHNNNWNRPKYRASQPRYNNNFRPRNNGWNRAQYRVSQPRHNNWNRPSQRVSQPRFRGGGQFQGRQPRFGGGGGGRQFQARQPRFNGGGGFQRGGGGGGHFRGGGGGGRGRRGR